MQNVTVNKTELLDILHTNRDGHKAIFDEACEGYKAECIKQLEAHLEQVKSNKMFRVIVSLPVPEEHTSDYNRAIRMLEMELKNEVVVDEATFQCLVLDDWNWKHQFLTSNASYSVTAGTALKNF